MKSGYRYIKNTIQNRGTNPELKALHRTRVQQWNHEESFVRIDRPTDLFAARRLGYKPMYGIFLVRARVRKGSHRKPQIKGGRRPKRKGITKITIGVSLQTIAEQRVQKKYLNTEVLNSYYVGRTGKHEYYEVILVENMNSSIRNRMSYASIASQKGRVYRGLVGSHRSQN